MSQLSESQRLRAEQNRLKALQIRQQKMAALEGSNKSQGAPQTAADPSQLSKGPPQITATAPKTIAVSLPACGGATKFYPKQGSSVSGTSNLTTGGTISNVHGTSQATLRAHESAAATTRIEAGTKTQDTSPSSLPPNVKRQIEEKKRKAQELREYLKKMRGEKGACVPPIPSASTNTPPARNHLQTTTQVSSASMGTPAARNSLQTSSQECQPSTSVPKSTTQPSAPKPSRIVTVSFELSSATTFRATTTEYHATTIQIFKTVPSRVYDCNIRTWSFNIKDHKSLVASLRPLHPEVVVVPLPDFVLKALEASAKKVPADCIDLMGLDARLLDALMPFQAEGVKFGISLGGRVMLADEMGLGKTIQALAIACHYQPDWPVLVVTPSSMRYSWEESILRWVSFLGHQDICVMTPGNNNYEEAQVVVVSYDLLSRKADTLRHHNFGIAIFDESHMIKNFKSARYKAAAPIMKKVKRLIMLSGTPALSRPMELYTQISSINPSLFPYFKEYGLRYCEGKQDPWGWSFKGSSNTEELQIVLRSCVWIRRLKTEVLSQLPSKQRMTVILNAELVKINKRNPNNLSVKSLSSLQEIDHFQLFTRTADAKIAAVKEYIKEVLESGRKFLVFGHHRSMLDSLSTLCQETKTNYIRIDGRTSSEERMANVTKFQNRDDVQVAVLSITAANTGITLTAAQLVIFAELYWNPGILVQAEDRVHRIGQKDSVVVQYLVARNTADDHIWPLIQDKLEVLGKVGLSDDKLDMAEMSYQKGAGTKDIRDYMEWNEDSNDSKNESPKKQRERECPLPSV
ncbi:SWI/SNF-related matrix-associated actin-dependent regulator of chromatin subfamily A-like protein 1 isoform X2 [Eriocheir sinensis]|uniref:SWI/SNF-related matrix-associated actin-dependent regulator of chromatin subfamily A-like protein 1 isoform X2 n=1 Tax=Eriocheir sinensis TaxID=95602 RepID=UPI0021C8460B|nr:SWI/SNF-related matrix-associated actin-dependent regulator of chromatin subfamily A-like protein 1 isoform X2 [Eriocheir sinensis]